MVLIHLFFGIVKNQPKIRFYLLNPFPCLCSGLVLFEHVFCCSWYTQFRPWSHTCSACWHTASLCPCPTPWNCLVATEANVPVVAVAWPPLPLRTTAKRPARQDVPNAAWQSVVLCTPGVTGLVLGGGWPCRGIYCTHNTIINTISIFG